MDAARAGAPRAAENLYGLDRDELALLLAPFAPERFRARQVYAALYGRDALDPAGWTDLPRAVRDAIAARFRVERARCSHRTVSADGSRKLLFDLPRGGQVEAVAMPHGSRWTFCISSQVGCGFGCAFCMTARLGLTRNLDAGEIVGQVAGLVAETAAPRGGYNIVFMGMGEPLANLTAVRRALSILTDPAGFGLGPRRITVSTVGLPRGIRALAAHEVVPRLAISLVSAEPRVRAELMPVARSVDLDDLIAAVRDYGRGRRDRPTFEVVLLRDVNDSPAAARRLAEAARRARAKVNLIEFNETPELGFQPSGERRIERFLRILRRGGVVGTVRRSRGRDVDAACGQLAFSTRAAVTSERPRRDSRGTARSSRTPTGA